MTPKPRNEHTPIPAPTRRVIVGDRQNGGQVSASVGPHRLRGRRVFIGVAELGGQTIDVSVDDARVFALALLALVDGPMAVRPEC